MNYGNKHRYIATCPEETKELVARELRELGANEICFGYKAFEFSASTATIYQISLKTRTASRILKVIKEGYSGNQASLLALATKIPWPDIIPGGATFLVDGVIADRGTNGMKSNDISKMVRRGLEKSFEDRKIKKPTVDLKNPKVIVVAFLHKNRATISIDISNKALHKRGYRVIDDHPAPLKETLAASILLLAGYDGERPFFDPMCGSGTIAIEAAYIALNKAPLIHRKKGEFGFENLKGFDRPLWRKECDHARQKRLLTAKAPLYAADISPQYVKAAQQNALKARVEKHINFTAQSFIDSTPPCSDGILVTNLPYGERLDRDMGEERLKGFYQEIGNTLKRNYAGWRVALFVAEASPYKFIGLKPDKKINLLNGSIKCKLLIFNIYKGSKKEKKKG